MAIVPQIHHRQIYHVAGANWLLKIYTYEHEWPRREAWCVNCGTARGHPEPKCRYPRIELEEV